MFMHLGFAMIETGFCRAKNALNTMAMNLMIFPLSCAAFWVYGFAIGWGNFSNGAVAPGWKTRRWPCPTRFSIAALGFGSLANDAGKATGGYAYGLIGSQGFFLSGIEQSAAQAGALALFFFMMALVDKAALIPVGAMVERWRWKNFCLYGLWVVLPFALFANWVWGGGWLAGIGLNWHLGHGVIDFSGAGVIHALGGVIAPGRRLAAGARARGNIVRAAPSPCPATMFPWWCSAA